VHPRSSEHRLIHERGQATVEFALVMPLFIIALALPILVTAVCCQELTVQTLARNCARLVAAASPDTSSDQQAIQGLSHLFPDASFRTHQQNTLDAGSLVTVEVSKPLAVPFFVLLKLPLIKLHAIATFVREPPLSLG
jgi:Flp pilus assembly protein TadG